MNLAEIPEMPRLVTEVRFGAIDLFAQTGEDAFVSPTFPTRLTVLAFAHRERNADPRREDASRPPVSEDRDQSPSWSRRNSRGVCQPVCELRRPICRGSQIVSMRPVSKTGRYIP